MPSKEDICVVPDSTESTFLSADMDELVAAIKHNLQLKSKPSHGVYTKQRRPAPYSAPVRTVCRNKANGREIATDHSSPNCKYCILRAKSKSSKDANSDDPYEILTLLRKGILINEAVKRLQMDLENKRPKKTDFYEFDDLEVDVGSI